MDIALLAAIKWDPVWGFPSSKLFLIGSAQKFD